VELTETSRLIPILLFILQITGLLVARGSSCSWMVHCQTLVRTSCRLFFMDSNMY